MLTNSKSFYDSEGNVDMRKFVKMTNAALGTRESASHHEQKLKSWAETNVSVSHTVEKAKSLLLFGGQNLLH